MSLPLRLSLLALVAGSVLFAQETEAKPKFTWHHSSTSTFAWQAQFNLPLKDLGTALDQRTGGIGNSKASNPRRLNGASPVTFSSGGFEVKFPQADS